MLISVISIMQLLKFYFKVSCNMFSIGPRQEGCELLPVHR